ncbi:3'(2'),5'-bisphosphate nucleotidase CysQ [Nereida sp. MMG025]|uniref:inositol monophosphatase family protein n=1 Tax=Nereida sp. MMG025 TaxID=2909981 RepID=UPI001F1FB20E|nr:3'(2'),5'-bisphosphate nucleotidase CysQ [Nereida sp. MMG025]MCF6444767.1 3'(2'),5'-bisphosphate nucleotidase CysQ [Nereida sp. MMG025]
MQESDLDLLVRAAHQAGDIARGFFRADPKVWDKADNAGPVTEADLRVNDMLETMLPQARPGYGWLSEETEDVSDRHDASRIFVIDPIDGTRAFIEGSRTWSHSLAIVENGVPIAAVVYLPMMDKMYTASRGGGAFLNETSMRVATSKPVDESTVLAAKPNFENHHWKDGTPPVIPHFRSSLAYRLALVAQGRFDAMITLRPTWEWDVAAGALLVEEAGGTVTGRLGEAPLFNNTHPQLSGMIAGQPQLHDTLLGALA